MEWYCHGVSLSYTQFERMNRRMVGSWGNRHQAQSKLAFNCSECTRGESRTLFWTSYYLLAWEWEEPLTRITGYCGCPTSLRCIFTIRWILAESLLIQSIYQTRTWQCLLRTSWSNLKWNLTLGFCRLASDLEKFCKATPAIYCFTLNMKGSCAWDLDNCTTGMIL